MKFLLTGLLGLMAMFTIANNTYAEDSGISEATYINGGFGQEEADEMRAKAGEFNLRLYLSQGKQGQSVADVPVTILDKKGNVKLELAGGGPMLFLQLEKGTYKINAQHNGVTLSKKVTIINQRGVNVYLNWKNTEVDMEDEQLKER